MNQRIKNDIWKGLYEFQLIESDNKISDVLQLFKNNRILKVAKWQIHHIKEYKHVLTHQVIHATFYFIEINIPINDLVFDLVENFNFYNFNQIENLPKPVLIDNYLKEEIF